MKLLYLYRPIQRPIARSMISRNVSQPVIYERVTSKASRTGIEVTYEKYPAVILTLEMLLHIAEGLRLDGAGRDKKLHKDTQQNTGPQNQRHGWKL
jgi:hypothetical protein